MAVRRVFSLFGLFVLSVFGADPGPKPQYTVDAIRFATLAGYKVSSLVYGADPARTKDLAMMFWLVRGGGRNLLVDSGFYRPDFWQRYTIRDFKKPTEALETTTGLKPEDITDIVITHAHWDHSDGVDLFPKARIWIQRDEFMYYTTQVWQEGKRSAMDPKDVIAFVKINMQGRLKLVDGEKEIIPGINCYVGGKHTYAIQHIGIHTAQGTVILASDNVDLYENLEKHAPNAGASDKEANLKAQDRMHTLATEDRLIIPGHDPAVFDRFKGPMPGIVRIE